jgi:hypothetical protein
VIGIDILNGCKGATGLARALFCLTPFFPVDPAKQFALVATHIRDIRENIGRKASRVTIFVERNLGFEAEHHRRALDGIPGVTFYVDQAADRVGVLTTEQVKHAMCQLVVAMLRERRIHIASPLVSRNEHDMRTRLREQMEIYGYQTKLPANTFQKERIALSGKIGGMQDDICICLQLACYFTQIGEQRAAQCFARPE